MFAARGGGPAAKAHGRGVRSGRAGDERVVASGSVHGAGRRLRRAVRPADPRARAPRAAGAALANLFLWAGHPLYPHYAATATAQHRGALSDQQAAGGVMLVEQSLVVFGLLTWLLARTLRDAGRRQELAELAAAHDVPLD